MYDTVATLFSHRAVGSLWQGYLYTLPCGAVLVVRELSTYSLRVCASDTPPDVFLFGCCSTPYLINKNVACWPLFFCIP